MAAVCLALSSTFLRGDETIGDHHASASLAGGSVHTAANAALASLEPRSVASKRPRPLVVARRARSRLDRYMHLEQDACEAELASRRVAFRRAERVAGVRAPVRLRGSLAGVAIHSQLSPSARAVSASEIFDCRLVLTLHDFAADLARREISAIVFMSAYRSRADYGCTKKYLGEQHCAALAVDVAGFLRKDGAMISVERDFNGKVGIETCDDDTHPVVDTPRARALWDIVCDAAGTYFNVILTPNYNAAHNNHFHLELTRHDWVLAR